MDLHSAHDADRLSFETVADFLHVEDRTHQVHFEPQVVEVRLAEQFHMRRQEFLRKIESELEVKLFTVQKKTGILLE